MNKESRILKEERWCRGQEIWDDIFNVSLGVLFCIGLFCTIVIAGSMLVAISTHPGAYFQVGSPSFQWLHLSGMITSIAGMLFSARKMLFDHDTGWMVGAIASAGMGMLVLFV